VGEINWGIYLSIIYQTTIAQTDKPEKTRTKFQINAKAQNNKYEPHFGFWLFCPWNLFVFLAFVFPIVKLIT